MRISDWSSDVCSSDLATPAARTPPSALPANRATSPDCARMVIASIANAPTAAAANSSTAMLPRGLPRDPDDSRPPVPTPLRAGPVHRQPFRQGSTQHHRSEEHTSELQSLMRISYAVFCLKKKNTAHKQR